MDEALRPEVDGDADPAMHYCKFAVNEKPYCIWDWDLPARSLRFLDGVDPWYFAHVGEVHSRELEGESRQHAAVALRLAYSQAQETFFAFLAAAIQAPGCPLGWILRYETSDLRAVVTSIGQGGPKFSRIDGPLSWYRLAELINSYDLGDLARVADLRKGYAAAWARFASEFVNREAIDEYNALKHGLRARAGGFSLRVGIEETYGSPVPEEAMGPWVGSQFGTSYHTTEWLASPKANFRARNASRNWHPEDLTAGLYLLAFSTAAVIGYLKVVGGQDPRTVRIKTPGNLEIFGAPWKFVPGISSINFDVLLGTEDITPFSRADILESYQPEDSYPPETHTKSEGLSRDNA